MQVTSGQLPLIVHIIYRLDIGGLESVLVQFINHCPTDKFRHAIICLTDFTDFRDRIKINQVEIYALHKKAGKDFTIYPKMWRLLRKLRPTIVHTYNLATIEHQFTAFLAGISRRVHAEHGRDFSDPFGTNKKYNLLRKLLRPFISRWVPVSQDLSHWLKTRIGVPDKKNILIYNGVDTAIFKPGNCVREKLPPGFRGEDRFVIGTVGRLDPVKDQETLILAFKQITNQAKYHNTRLVIIGDGPLHNRLEKIIAENKLGDRVWLAGSRNDIPELLNCFELFVLPSIAEGIPMTILEAMATGIPVIATNVGGNVELINNGKEGYLISPGSTDSLCKAIRKYIDDAELCLLHGRNGMMTAFKRFSLMRMVENYTRLYDSLINDN